MGMQLDKKWEQKWKWQQSVESKGDWCAKQKTNLQLTCVHEGQAQLDGHFYEHGKAFNTSENEKVNDDDMDKKMAAKPSSKRVHRSTDLLKVYKGYDIDTTTGYPICPRSKEIIDGTRLYCKFCNTFGHSRRSFNGCEKHKEFLDEKKENNTNKKKGKNWYQRIISK